MSTCEGTKRSISLENSCILLVFNQLYYKRNLLYLIVHFFQIPSSLFVCCLSSLEPNKFSFFPQQINKFIVRTLLVNQQTENKTDIGPLKLPGKCKEVSICFVKGSPTNEKSLHFQIPLIFLNYIR